MTTLAEIAASIIQNKETGLLSIVEKKGEHHLKIFFEEGRIYYMTYGDLKNAQCVACCDKLEFSEYFFTKGAKVAANEKCAAETAAIIEQLKICMDKSQAGPLLTDNPGVQNFPVALQTKLKEAFIRQIGPVGEIVFSNILQQWTAASPAARERLKELVERMSETIEDEKSRQAFVKEAGSIIQ